MSKVKNAPWKEKDAKMDDYFNYGFNEEQWEKYSEKIKSKFEELRENIKEKRLPTLSEKDALAYLLKFPSDYGGLGDIFTADYDNVNIFDNKTNINKLVPIAKGEQVFINLEQAPQLPSGTPNILNNSIINGNIPKNSSETFNININQTPSNYYSTINSNFPLMLYPRQMPFVMNVPMTIRKKDLDLARYYYIY
ncbi:MAG: pre-mRNA polyadenylation factor Fip1 domain-containing protein [archaeon]|nr:pre-mRNA polyadenylation factor Fip1 domain-containing protein [archaeon]